VTDGERFSIVMGRDGEASVVSGYGGVGIRLGESGGVGCSSGLIDRGVSGLLCSCFQGIETCRGDIRRFPVIGEGCDSFQDGPSLRTNSSCFSTKGTVRMGGICGKQDEEAFGGKGSTSGESSFRFPLTGEG